MIRLFVSLLIVTAAGVTALVLAWPVRAADTCAAPLDKTVGDIQDGGGYLVDLIDVRSEHFDQVLVVVMNGHLLIGGVKAGCMASPPLAIDTVEPVTPA